MCARLWSDLERRVIEPGERLDPATGVWVDATGSPPLLIACKATLRAIWSVFPVVAAAEEQLAKPRRPGRPAP